MHVDLPTWALLGPTCDGCPGAYHSYLQAQENCSVPMPQSTTSHRFLRMRGWCRRKHRWQLSHERCSCHIPCPFQWHEQLEPMRFVLHSFRQLLSFSDFLVHATPILHMHPTQQHGKIPLQMPRGSARVMPLSLEETCSPSAVQRASTPNKGGGNVQHTLEVYANHVTLQSVQAVTSDLAVGKAVTVDGTNA